MIIKLNLKLNIVILNFIKYIKIIELNINLFGKIICYAILNKIKIAFYLNQFQNLGKHLIYEVNIIDIKVLP